jgi:hypothetical protein
MEGHEFANEEEYRAFLSDVEDDIRRRTTECMLGDTHIRFVDRTTINKIPTYLIIKKFIAHSESGKSWSEQKLNSLSVMIERRRQTPIFRSLRE